MAKTTASFNLSKSAKRIAASILDKAERRIYLDKMIEAEADRIVGKSRKFVDPAVGQQKNRPVPQE